MKKVAIDGPSASGKSTVAKGVAKALGFVYVDSGALYRGVTWNASRRGIDPADAESVVRAMREAEWRFFVRDAGVAGFSVDGIEPTRELREKPVREAVALVAAVPAVRDFVVERLRGLAECGALVMEGRDIGTVVFPETPYKFYLDADPEERAMRRYRELVSAGEREKAEEVLESLRRRDRIDSTRKAAPLKIATDARVVDTTGMTIDDVVGFIVNAVKGAGNE